MLEKVTQLQQEVNGFNSSNSEEIEKFRIAFLGKKGHLTDLFNAFKSVAPEQKKDFGQAINVLKNTATEKVNAFKYALENNAPQQLAYGDLTKPAEPILMGANHPISIVKNKIIEDRKSVV